MIVIFLPKEGFVRGRLQATFGLSARLGHGHTARPHRQTNTVELHSEQ